MNGTTLNTSENISKSSIVEITMFINNLVICLYTEIQIESVLSDALTSWHSHWSLDHEVVVSEGDLPPAHHLPLQPAAVDPPHQPVPAVLDAPPRLQLRAPHLGQLLVLECQKILLGAN